MLVLYIYSYMGVLLFGTTKQGEGLSEHANFSNFPIALLTLIRLATNDNWNDLLAVRCSLSCVQQARAVVPLLRGAMPTADCCALPLPPPPPPGHGHLRPLQPQARRLHSARGVLCLHDVLRAHRLHRHAQPLHG